MSIKTKGFVTIATGDEKYYKMASTLMRSYKLSTKQPNKFAILADKENEYTAEFDDVILLSNPHKSYLDKIDLLVNTPYEETIFLDADCIAYNDLNDYWDIFSYSDDFSAFGKTYPLTERNRGWYKYEDIGKYKDQVSYVVSMHGGIYYIRKSEITDKIHEKAYEILRQYESYNFSGFTKPADEPILALAMAINNCKPTKTDSTSFVWLRRANKLKADFFTQKLSYDFNNQRVQEIGKLIHFGTSRAPYPLYLRESNKVNSLWENKSVWSRAEILKFNSKSYSKGFYGMAKTVLRKAYNKLSK